MCNPQSAIVNRQSYSPESIQDGLKTAWLGKGTIRCYETVDSTNIEAKRLARSGAPEGTIVLAESQSKGRGRMEREWISPRGEGIYMSVVLRPRILPEEVQKLTFVAAVALAFTLRRIGITPHIKWPNDILVNGKKVAGILMELTAGDGVADFVIVGIGINVNTSMNEFPLSMRNLATSINMVADRVVRRREIIKILLLQLELWYERFLTESFEIVLEAWRRLSNTLGARVMVVLSDKKLEGIAERVASDGSLMVRDDKGKLHRVIVGDVVHCRSL
ncbi:MAG: biotin--[acetyl-CoA-carboxylase] ligase [Deltaproteobacteria bacterium]|nr:biotin--[acetyl-CoA-carboxylase] ligase [Deltaproteobacteria bacterium]